MRKGCFEFRKASNDTARSLDDQSREAGESIGGVFGAPEQLITPDNQVAELYDRPEPPCNKAIRKWRQVMAAVMKFWASIRRSLKEVRSKFSRH